MSARTRLVVRGAGVAMQTAWSLGRVELLELLAGKAGRERYVDEHLPAWCQGVLKWAGITPLVEWAEAAEQTRGGLVVANHRSPMDVPLLLGLFGGHAVSRADLAGWPLLGRAATKAGTIFVDRSSAVSGARAIRGVRRALERGRTVVVFPEGTTFAGDEVRPFRRGILSSLAEVAVPVTPVGLAYPAGLEWQGGSFADHVRGIASRPSTPVAVQIGAALAPGSLEHDLQTATRRVVQTLVDRARVRLEQSLAGASPPHLDGRPVEYGGDPPVQDHNAAHVAKRGTP